MARPNPTETQVTTNASLAGKRVLVTGAGGFIGSHLTERVASAGAEVTALLRYNALSDIGNLRFLPPDILASVKLVWGNVEDGGFVADAVEGMDVVFHLAALISIPFSYQAPRSFLTTNLFGALNLLEAARRRALGRLVLTSTSEVYGSALREPIDEAHPLKGQSPYSASKIAADALAESFALSFDADIVTVRPFNVYGPRQSARAFIPAIMVQALWRDEILLGDLAPRRDVTFAQDTVRAFEAAAVAPEARGGVFNIGSGEALAIGEFAGRILRMIGVDKPIRHDTDRVRPARSEVLNLRCDASRAEAALGWRPSIDLETGLARTLAFVQSHRELYTPERYAI